MSVSYTAAAVLGVEIDLAKLPTETVVERAFRHDFPESMNYDPQTGRALWRRKTRKKVCFDKDWAQPGQTLIAAPNCRAFWSTDQKRLVFGVGVRVTDEGDVESLPILNQTVVGDLVSQLRTALEPHGLWSPHRFGLHVVMHCSY